MEQNHTISAIATAPGEGGIGIIRLSGAGAIDIGRKIFLSKKGRDILDYPTRHAIFGDIRDENNSFLDEAICLVMKKPYSYTGEDVVEFQCHGGGLLLREILALTYRLGAKNAEPGEFTKRAFLNGRLDLTKAQAIMDMIGSKTKTSLEMASRQLEGGLAEHIRELRGKVLGIIAHLEASIDFPEDDIENVAIGEAEKSIVAMKNNIDELLKTANAGIILRDGLKTAIIGRPNAGKSSLMNLLLKRERAIVTDIPGTTRDSIEEYVSIAGIPLQLIDTAGLRDTEDMVEKIGVERALKAASQADLLLAVIDGSTDSLVEAEELLELLKESKGKAIIILNKSDLGLALDEEALREMATTKEVDNINKIIKLSAKEKIGTEALEEAICQLVYGKEAIARESIMVSDARQAELLRQAGEMLEQALTTVRSGMSEDFIVIDLRTVWEVLGEILGENIDDDIIDEIFRRFCIGK